jgi:ABC-type Mn2+/Zn2+ transport system permease subunit
MIELMSLPFMQYALACCLLGGTALAMTGSFVLMRRVSFSGLAVSQMAALGVVVASITGMHDLEATAVSLLVVAAGLVLENRLLKVRRVPEESWVAGLYILAAGVSVLLLSKDPQGESHTLSVFFGNVLGLDPGEVLEAVILFVSTGAILGPWFSRWVYLFFDPTAAEIDGLPVKRWNLLFIALFAVSMSTAIHLFGVLLAFSFLLMPAAAGLALCRSLRSLFWFIPVMTASCVVAGIALSFYWDFPTGPFIAALLSAAALSAGLLRSLRA